MKISAVFAGQRRLVFGLYVLLTIGFLATAIGSYIVSKGSIRQSIIERELPLTIDTVYSEIQKDIIRPVFISSLMASDTFVRDWVLAGESDTVRMTRYLREIKDRYGAVVSFFVSERTLTYYHFNGVLKKVREDEPRDAWYFRVRDMKDDYEINVDPDLANQDTMTIFINFRVFDYQGRYLGATGVGLTVDTVRHLIEDYQKRYQRSIQFVDKAGQLVRFGGHTADAPSNIRSLEGVRDVAERVLGTQAGSFEYEKDGQTHLLNTRYIPELRWYLLVERVEEDAIREVRDALRVNVGVWLVVTIIMLWLTNVTINRYQRHLETMATTDKLTGLLNRQAFEVLFDQALHETKRSKLPLAVMMMDIDEFKSVNDRFGHAAGDVVLAGIAQLVRENLRESDSACRWGGDEFCVLLRQCDAPGAEAIAAKLRRAVESGTFQTTAGPLGSALSIGVAQYRAGETEEEITARADARLYEAKRGGRNRVVGDPV